MAGYIYVLINPSIANMVKIGMTARSVEERVAELSSSTGVPTPFVIAYQEYVDEPAKLEKQLHKNLELQGYRVNSKREFFEAPLNIVLQSLNQILATSTEIRILDQDRSTSHGDEGNRDRDSEWELGDDHYQRAAELLANPQSINAETDRLKAEKLLELAASLGNRKAKLSLSSITSSRIKAEAVMTAIDAIDSDSSLDSSSLIQAEETRADLLHKEVLEELIDENFYPAVPELMGCYVRLGNVSQIRRLTNYMFDHEDVLLGSEILEQALKIIVDCHDWKEGDDRLISPVLKRYFPRFVGLIMAELSDQFEIARTTYFDLVKLINEVGDISVDNLGEWQSRLEDYYYIDDIEKLYPYLNIAAAVDYLDINFEQLNQPEGFESIFNESDSFNSESLRKHIDSMSELAKLAKPMNALVDAEYELGNLLSEIGYSYPEDISNIHEMQDELVKTLNSTPVG